MKTFYQFIGEDFNSHSASQFMIPVSTISRRGSVEDSGKTTMLFYEHVNGTSFNLSRYVKSFIGSNVADLMKAPTNDFRYLIYSSQTGFDVFAWQASIQHSFMTKSLEANKDLKRYPDNIRYHFLYNESQLYMKGDHIGVFWCFPFVFWQGGLTVNLTLESLRVFESTTNLKSALQFSDTQWNSLLKSQDCKL